MADDAPESVWLNDSYTQCGEFVIEGMRKARAAGLGMQDLSRALIDLAAMSAYQVAGDEGLDDAIARLKAFRETFRARRGERVM
jgi:hypothetical protein